MADSLLQYEEVFSGSRLVVIAGPCAIESESVMMETAGALKDICVRLDLPFIFKSSYDKANRSSLKSYRGPGIDVGLRILSDIRSRLQIPVITDVHTSEEAAIASRAVDMLQIPAFLCRQTDLILSVSSTGLPANIKKGQFLSPWDVCNIFEKFTSTGNKKVTITERGTTFGYNNLVVDFRSFPIMKTLGYPVIFDITHSLQLPGGLGASSGGQREYALPLARGAAGAGIDGFFFETHPDPRLALCDGPNMIPLGDVEGLLRISKKIFETVNEGG